MHIFLAACGFSFSQIMELNFAKAHVTIKRMKWKRKEKKKGKAIYGTTSQRKRLHLRYGWSYLSWKQDFTRGQGICGVAVSGEQTVFVLDQQRRKNAQGVTGKVSPHGTGCGRASLLHQCAGNSRIYLPPESRSARLCDWRAGTVQCTVWKGHHPRRQQSRLCGDWRIPKL